jgi:hypothetical protein
LLAWGDTGSASASSVAAATAIIVIRFMMRSPRAR